jgi:cyclophilin family peptidyl-prolyl cis-trans isomerase
MLPLLLLLFALAGADPPDQQAVIETSVGTIVLDLLPEAAPKHVAHFVARAKEGAYDGTAFHRVIAMGIIQGGDPLSKDPSQKDRYGTGGLGVLRFEANAEKHTRGAVSAVLVPGKRDSAGSQFFICVTDQPSLDGQYTIFARVAEGIHVAQQISLVPADAKAVPTDRVEMKRVTIRDKPAPAPEPFVYETCSRSSTTRRTTRASSRWRGSMIRPARTHRSSSSRRGRLHSMGSTRYSAASWRVWTSSTRSKQCRLLVKCRPRESTSPVSRSSSADQCVRAARCCASRRAINA